MKPRGRPPLRPSVKRARCRLAKARIRQAMADLDLSLAAIAGKLGVTEKAAGNWLKGRHGMSVLASTSLDNLLRSKP